MFGNFFGPTIASLYTLAQRNAYGVQRYDVGYAAGYSDGDTAGQATAEATAMEPQAVDLSAAEWTLDDPLSASGIDSSWTDNGDGTYTISVNTAVTGFYFFRRPMLDNFGAAVNAAAGNILASYEITIPALLSQAGVSVFTGITDGAITSTGGRYSLLGFLQDTGTTRKASNRRSTAGTNGDAVTLSNAATFASYPKWRGGHVLTGSFGGLSGTGAILDANGGRASPLSETAASVFAMLLAAPKECIAVRTDGTGSQSYDLTVAVTRTVISVR